MKKIKAKTGGWKSKFPGKWRIISMEDFDRSDIDMEVPAHITIGKEEHGTFQFILVSGDICGSYKEEGGRRILDFTWIGMDECDEANGDGWAELVSDSRMRGEIRFHCGDTYKFEAKRKNLCKDLEHKAKS